jgi:hypothetical protein
MSETFKINRMIRARDLVGLTEVAERFRVSTPAVAQWRKRYPDFPAPVVDLACGPVFDVTDVIRWYHGRPWDKRGNHQH